MQSKYYSLSTYIEITILDFAHKITHKLFIVKYQQFTKSPAL